jgi:hypothetical protein
MLVVLVPSPLDDAAPCLKRLRSFNLLLSEAQYPDQHLHGPAPDTQLPDPVAGLVVLAIKSSPVWQRHNNALVILFDENDSAGATRPPHEFGFIEILEAVL